MHYFAYGSNMCSERMIARVPSAQAQTIGYILGHQLRFHKRGYRDGTGKCNAWCTNNPADIVWGVIYAINQAELKQLHWHEGHGDGYLMQDLQIVCGGDVRKAFAYIAEPHVIDDALKPLASYVDFVLRGAAEHGLPSSYIAQIKNDLSYA